MPLSLIFASEYVDQGDSIYNNLLLTTVVIFDIGSFIDESTILDLTNYGQKKSRN